MAAFALVDENKNIAYAYAPEAENFCYLADEAAHPGLTVSLITDEQYEAHMRKLDEAFAQVRHDALKPALVKRIVDVHDEYEHYDILDSHRSIVAFSEYVNDMLDSDIDIVIEHLEDLAFETEDESIDELVDDLRIFAA